MSYVNRAADNGTYLPPDSGATDALRIVLDAARRAAERLESVPARESRQEALSVRNAIAIVERDLLSAAVATDEATELIPLIRRLGVAFRAMTQPTMVVLDHAEHADALDRIADVIGRLLSARDMPATDALRDDISEIVAWHKQHSENLYRRANHISERNDVSGFSDIGDRYRQLIADSDKHSRFANMLSARDRAGSGEGATPHCCPACRGSGLRNFPAGMAADQQTFSSSSMGPWPCVPCNGTGILWAAPDPQPTPAPQAEAPAQGDSEVQRLRQSCHALQAAFREAYAVVDELAPDWSGSSISTVLRAFLVAPAPSQEWVRELGRLVDSLGELALVRNTTYDEHAQRVTAAMRRITAHVMGRVGEVKQDCSCCRGYGYISQDPTREPCSECGGSGRVMGRVGDSADREEAMPTAPHYQRDGQHITIGKSRPLSQDFVPSGAPPSDATTGASLIAAERRRQSVEEGWSIKHDDQHTDESLALAAMCYAAPGNKDRDYCPPAWPWDVDWWKPEPHDRVRELVKAGALIAAEIDRLLRIGAARTQGTDAPG